MRQRQLVLESLLLALARGQPRVLIAAPIWLATAVTSFRSRGVKRSESSESVRLMTPMQRAGAPGAA